MFFLVAFGKILVELGPPLQNFDAKLEVKRFLTLWS